MAAAAGMVVSMVLRPLAGLAAGVVVGVRCGPLLAVLTAVVGMRRGLILAAYTAAVAVATLAVVLTWGMM